MNVQIDLGGVHPRAPWSKTGGQAAQAALAEQLESMAVLLGARHYLVLRIGAIAARASGSLSVVQTSPGGGAEARHEAVAARFGPTLLAHMDSTLLPLVHRRQLRGRGDSRLAASMRMAAVPHSSLADVECLAFPVKLGALGNGVVLFYDETVAPSDEHLLEVHRKCYKVLKSLLRVDLRKSAPRQNLNDRELACLQLAGEGLKSELIAVQLALSVHTVNAYLSSATAKLDSVNRIQAIAKAIRLGYLA